MDTVQWRGTSFKSTVPDSSKRSCPHAPGKEHTVIIVKLWFSFAAQIVSVLTGFRGWRHCCGSLRDGDGLRRTRRKMAHASPWCVFMGQSGRRVRSLCEVSLLGSMQCGGVIKGHDRCGQYVYAAAHVAALDGDWFGHVHAKQGAEGLWLRGTHAGHSSGLDPISTGHWTLKSNTTRWVRMVHWLSIISYKQT